MSKLDDFMNAKPKSSSSKAANNLFTGSDDNTQWTCRYCDSENVGGKVCSSCGKNKLVKARTTVHPDTQNRENPRSKRFQILMTPSMYKDLETVAVLKSASMNAVVNEFLQDGIEKYSNLIELNRSMCGLSVEEQIKLIEEVKNHGSGKAESN